MKARSKKMKDRFFTHGYMQKERLVNAGEILLSYIKGHRVIALDISVFHDSDEKKDIHLTLKKGFTKHQFRHVLNVLKHCWYDAEYDIQNLNSTVWCDNGIWFVRDIGDATWKKYFSKKKYPPIPHKLS